MLRNAILLSIKPQYADKIFEGTKTVELRRVRPKHITRNDLVLIYVSSPVKSLAGAFKVDKVIEKPLLELWKAVKDKAGITRKEFDNYYKGISIGIAIFFYGVRHLPKPIELQELKAQMTNFQPPQSFRYARPYELSSLQLSEFAKDITSKALENKYL